MLWDPFSHPEVFNKAYGWLSIQNVHAQDDALCLATWKFIRELIDLGIDLD